MFLAVSLLSLFCLAVFAVILVHFVLLIFEMFVFFTINIFGAPLSINEWTVKHTFHGGCLRSAFTNVHLQPGLTGYLLHIWMHSLSCIVVLDIYGRIEVIFGFGLCLFWVLFIDITVVLDIAEGYFRFWFITVRCFLRLYHRRFACCLRS